VNARHLLLDQLGENTQIDLCSCAGSVVVVEQVGLGLREASRHAADVFYEVHEDPEGVFFAYDGKCYGCEEEELGMVAHGRVTHGISA
jgi:hypothetical protein